MRLTVLAVALLGLTLLASRWSLADPDPLRRRLQAAGASGAVVFTGGYALACLVPFPKTALTVAAGALFGVPLGAGLVILAGTAGALVAFAAGRLLGRAAVDRLGATRRGPRVEATQQLLERRGFGAVLLARLIPMVPFTTLNYVAGATRLRPVPFAVATVLGMAPVTVAYVALGRYGTRPASWQFGLSVGMLAAATGAGLLVARRHRRADQGEGPGTA